MRIWDIPVECLCRKHLLGEHAELHAMWAIITGDRRGFANHPETIRWRGKLKALYNRHEAQADEMRERGYKHRSDLDYNQARGEDVQDSFVYAYREQIADLSSRCSECQSRIARRMESSEKGITSEFGSDIAGSNPASPAMAE